MKKYLLSFLFIASIIPTTRINACWCCWCCNEKEDQTNNNPPSEKHALLAKLVTDAFKAPSNLNYKSDNPAHNGELVSHRTTFADNQTDFTNDFGDDEFAGPSNNNKGALPFDE